ncbi:MAG: D-glycero-beta-D-manno-heptose 1-phosphate adenylyltransferase [Ginsengibacter sp.]
MKHGNRIVEKILTMDQLSPQLVRWKLLGKTISFTNGVFDIIHEGHIKVLTQAASFADILIVGLNADASVKRLKGKDRPINNEHSRALVLSALLVVDAVVLFEEDTPLNLIKIIKPNVLVKGGDYTQESVVGVGEVLANHGRVEIVPLEKGFSSTAIIEKLKQL